MRAFEATGRLGSVSAAAAELAVTSGAVSQQIRLLETVLGAKLVARAGRGMTLTAEGRAVAELIAEPFRGLREASRRLGRCDNAELIRLGAPGALAAGWLAPRIERFETHSRGVPVRLISDPDPSALDRFQVDLEIRFADRPSQGANAVRLLTESYAALITPNMMAAISGGDWRDLVKTCRLIQCDECDRAGLDWRSWLARRGSVREDAHSGDRYALAEHAVSAAAAGRGMALAPRSIAEPGVESGRLAVLIAAGVEPVAGGYDLVWPEGRGLRAPDRALKTHLIEESRPFEHAGL